MLVDEEFVVKFEPVTKLRDTPHPRDLRYLNACLFAFDKTDGILIYTNIDGGTIEFSLTRNNRMFQEIIRRARILKPRCSKEESP